MLVICPIWNNLINIVLFTFNQDYYYYFFYFEGVIFLLNPSSLNDAIFEFWRILGTTILDRWYTNDC